MGLCLRLHGLFEALHQSLIGEQRTIADFMETGRQPCSPPFCDDNGGMLPSIG